jgi:hypothetical protein
VVCWVGEPRRLLPKVFLKHRLQLQSHGGFQGVQRRQVFLMRDWRGDEDGWRSFLGRDFLTFILIPSIAHTLRRLSPNKRPHSDTN